MPSAAFLCPPEFYIISLHDAFRSRYAGGSGHKVRARAQPEDCQGAVAEHSVRLAHDRRRNNRLTASHSSFGDVRFLAQSRHGLVHRDRKSTRLNSSHLGISYAVCCFPLSSRVLHYFPTRRFPISICRWFWPQSSSSCST